MNYIRDADQLTVLLVLVGKTNIRLSANSIFVVVLCVGRDVYHKA